MVVGKRGGRAYKRARVRYMLKKGPGDRERRIGETCRDDHPFRPYFDQGAEEGEQEESLLGNGLEEYVNIEVEVRPSAILYRGKKPVPRT